MSVAAIRKSTSFEALGSTCIVYRDVAFMIQMCIYSINYILMYIYKYTHTYI